MDRNNGIPLYIQIKNQILYQMNRGTLQPGNCLPSIRQMAAQLQVTTATVRHAYDSLEHEGYVVSRQGKGVIVNDLKANGHAQIDERQEKLLALLAPALVDAYSLGFSPSEVRSAITLAATLQQNPAKVLFVGSQPEFVEYYPPLLAEALADLRAEVSGALLQDLKRQSGLDPLDPPACVVTLVRSYNEVREALAEMPVPVVGLALEFAPDTQRALLDLPREARVLVVAERMNLPGLAHVIQQYHLPDAGLNQLSLESRDLGRALAETDIVLHTLRARRATLRLAPANVRFIELHHVPNPLSLSRVRDVIQSRVSADLSPSLA